MIALLILPLVMVFAFSNVFEDEIERIAEENGIDGFDPEEPSIYDDLNADFGTNSADTLIGTEGDDVLFALGQRDYVDALGGDDLEEAGSNNDTVYGGGGDDILGGGTGADTLVGESGHDALIGNGGDDLLLGRSGNDFLVGGGGTDSLNGGTGDDLLISGNAEVGKYGEVDVSATGLAVIRAYVDGVFDDVDFETLDAEGAFNGVDPSFLSERPEPTQGGDLRGGDGDDMLILAGADTASGGAGEDIFVLDEDMVNERTVHITDYSETDDVIAVEYKGTEEPVLDTRDRGEDAIILIGEDILALVEGAAGLSVSDLRLVQLPSLRI